MYDPSQYVEKRDQHRHWQWHEWVERINLTPTYAEMIGLLKGYGPSVVAEMGQADGGLAYVLDFFGNCPIFHREWNQQTKVEEAASEVLVGFLKGLDFNRVKIVAAEWKAPIDLLQRGVYPFREPFRRNLTEVARKLVVFSSSWDEVERHPIYELVIKLEAHDLLLGHGVGLGALEALEDYVFGSLRDFRRQVPNPRNWVLDDLKSAMSPYFPERNRRAAAALCALAIRFGRMQERV